MSQYAWTIAVLIERATRERESSRIVAPLVEVFFRCWLEFAHAQVQRWRSARESRQERRELASWRAPFSAPKRHCCGVYQTEAAHFGGPRFPADS